jgi:predicted nucleotide-binding protein
VSTEKQDLSSDVLSATEAAEQLKQKIATADDQDESDFLKLSHEIAILEAELDKVNDRKKNIQLINDQVGGWTNRVGEKLTEQVDEALRPEEANQIFGSP